jgi:CRISPR-associated protein Csb3
MSIEPNIRVAVDPTNPGQFFACCGLLELADRLWSDASQPPAAEGWFSPDATEFRIRCGGTLVELLQAISQLNITNTMTAAERARLKALGELKGAVLKKSPELEEEKKALEKKVREDAIVLPGAMPFTIDWFLDDHAGGSRFKTWAGRSRHRCMPRMRR